MGEKVLIYGLFLKFEFILCSVLFMMLLPFFYAKHSKRTDFIMTPEQLILLSPICLYIYKQIGIIVSQGNAKGILSLINVLIM